MNFEEQFPSLKGKDGAFEYYQSTEWMQCKPSDSEADLHYVLVEDVQEHCLDKQRVRDVLRKLTDQFEESVQAERVKNRTLNAIEKELGL